MAACQREDPPIGYDNLRERRKAHCDRQTTRPLGAAGQYRLPASINRNSGVLIFRLG